MVIFFAILFTLIAVNATLLILSIRKSSARNSGEKAPGASEAAKIYPLDLETSKYKKAI